MPRDTGTTAPETRVDGRTDQELGAAASHGCADAFAVLIERHYDRIYRLAWRWCGSTTAAEDVAQDVCVKLAHAIRGYRGEAALTTWIYRIVYTTSTDHLRAAQRLRLLEPSQMMMLVEARALAANEPSNEVSAEVHVLHGELWDEVRRLTAQQRDAVLLVYGEDLSHAEAAQIMGCTENTVSWHLHAARKRLKATLEAVG